MLGALGLLGAGCSDTGAGGSPPTPPNKVAGVFDQKQMALELLRDGKVTFAKAAESARLSLWEFADLVKQRNVDWVRFSPEEIEREVREASAAKRK